MTGFYKLSGSGNDFLALTEPPEPPAAPTIRAWCRRRVSLGADGLFVLRRQGDAVSMEYWNADGFPADLCLNGTRCAAQLAFHLGWADGETVVRTAAGEIAARRLDERRVALEVPVAPGEPERRSVEAQGTTWTGFFVTVGVPHFVVPLASGDELAGLPVERLGRTLRFAPVFGPNGANVDFVWYLAPDRLAIRTYERGVEGETLSCGTGVLAAAVVGVALGRCRLPVKVETQSGFALEVAGGGQAGRWTLAGDARLVAQGELLAGAGPEEG